MEIETGQYIHLFVFAPVFQIFLKQSEKHRLVINFSPVSNLFYVISLYLQVLTFFGVFL